MQEQILTDADGIDVLTRRWFVEEPWANVVIAHGISEHSGRYDRFARALNDAGYGAAALDQRGHGRTGESSGVGKVGPGGGDALLEDLRLLVEDIRKAQPDVPLVLFGHSGGSMVVQAYVERFGAGLAGYVLSGCPGVMEGADELLAGLHAAVEGGMGDDALEVLGPFNDPFEPARTPYDWLSRDEAEVDAYLADPWCGDGNPVTYGFMAELVGLAVPAMSPEGIADVPEIPILMITGEQDPAAGMAAQARALEQLLRDAGREVTAHYYPDARHEVLNETNRDEVTADVVAWLHSVTGGPAAR